MNSIAGMAVAFEEADSLEFRDYAKQIVSNAKVLAESLREEGFKVFGTENHLMVVEVGEGKGKEVAEALEKAGIICNANTIPHDKAGAFRPSGMRLGTPWETTREMKEGDMRKIGEWIGRVVKKGEIEKVGEEIREFLKKGKN